MSQDAVNQLLTQFISQTTDRMVLILIFALALAFLADRGMAFLAKRSEDRGDQRMLELLGTISATNAELHKSFQASATRYSELQESAEKRNQQTVETMSKSIDALTISNGVISTAVRALDGRTEYLISQGQRLETGIATVAGVLTNGKTSTARIVEERMSTVDERLTALEKTVTEVDNKIDQVLLLLGSLGLAMQEVVRKGDTGRLDPAAVPDTDPDTRKPTGATP